MSMDLDAATAVYRESVRDSVRRHWGLYMFEAVVLVIAGLAAIVFPVFSSAVFVIVLGWLLIISGVAQAFALFGTRSSPGVWLQAVSVVLAIWVGVLLLRHVGEGMVVISLLLIVFFMIEGVSKIVFALTIRPLPNWGWVLASGLIGVVLSVALWSSMPVTAFWLIGLMLGINLITVGASLGAMAWTLRRAEA